jgi:hypothetical protein
MINKIFLPVIFIIALTITTWVAITVFTLTSVNLILILLIISMVSVYLFLTFRTKFENKFEGYVCEECGEKYNCCEHKGLEEYTLVKKA